VRGFLVLLANVAIRIALALALVALAAPAPASAPQTGTTVVFKCAGEGGVPVYQGVPCPLGRELRNLAVDPPNVSVVALDVAPAPPAKPPPARERPARAPARGTRPASPGDAAERRFVKEGMSEGEVLAKLGPPDAASAKYGRRARWTYLPAPGDPRTVTTIRLDDGRVTSVERAVVR
jgi:hypothetical protein